MKFPFFLSLFLLVTLLAGFVENFGKTDFTLPDVIVKDVTSQLIVPKQLNLKMFNCSTINYYKSDQYNRQYQIIRFNDVTIRFLVPFLSPPEREIGYYPALNDKVDLTNNEISLFQLERKKSSINMNLLFLPIENIRLDFRYSQFKNYLSSIIYSFINISSADKNPVNIMAGLNWSRNMESEINLFNIDFSNSNIFNNSKLKNYSSMNFSYLHRFYGYETTISMDSRAHSLFYRELDTNIPDLKINYWNQIKLTSKQMFMPIISNLTTSIWDMNGVPEYSVLLESGFKLKNSFFGLSISGDERKLSIFPGMDVKLFDNKNLFDIYLHRLVRAFPFKGETALYLVTPLAGIPSESVGIVGMKCSSFANSKEEFDLKFEYSFGNQNYFENDELMYSNIKFYDIDLSYRYLWNDYDNFVLSFHVQVPHALDYPYTDGSNILLRLKVSRKPANLPFGYEIKSFLVYSGSSINNYRDFVELKDAFGGLSIKILSRGNETVNEKLTFGLNYMVKISKEFEFKFINSVSCGINY